MATADTPQLREINDARLQAYLRGEITPAALRASLRGNEPYRFIAGTDQLEPIPAAEYRAALRPATTTVATATAILTPRIYQSPLRRALVAACRAARVDLRCHIWTNGYRDLIRQDPNIITWGVKWRHAAYIRGGRNVLFIENSLLRQSAGVHLDAAGLFAHSSIVQDAEYQKPPTALELHHLQQHIRIHLPQLSAPATTIPETAPAAFCGSTGPSGPAAFCGPAGPSGPILVALQTYRDAPVRYYYPLKGTEQDPNLVTLRLCAQHLPSDRPVLIRPHPIDMHKWDAALDTYRPLFRPNWSIDTSPDPYQLLTHCAALVTANSTLATEALACGLPVAVLGKSWFTGSNAVLDCSEDPSLLSGLLDWRPNQTAPSGAALSGYLCAVMRHFVPYNATKDSLRASAPFHTWLSRIQGAQPPPLVAHSPLSDADREHIQFQAVLQQIRIHADAIVRGLAEATARQLRDCPKCRHRRLKQRILSAAEVAHLPPNPFTPELCADLQSAGCRIHRPDLADYTASLQAARAKHRPGPSPIEIAPGSQIVLGFVYNSHLGDCLCGTVLPRLLKETYGCRVLMVRHRTTYELYRHNPYIDGHRNQGRIALARARCGPGHVLQRICRQWQVPEPDFPAPEIYLSDQERAYARTIRAAAGPGPLIAVSTGACSNNAPDSYATYPWQQWIHVLSAHAHIVQFLHRDDVPLAGALHYRDLSLRQYCAAVSACDAYFGTFAGGSHLAAAWRLPAIVVLNRQFTGRLAFPTTDRIGQFLYPQHHFATTPEHPLA